MHSNASGLFVCQREVAGHPDVNFADLERGRVNDVWQVHGHPSRKVVDCGK